MSHFVLSLLLLFSSRVADAAVGRAHVEYTLLAFENRRPQPAADLKTIQILEKLASRETSVLFCRKIRHYISFANSQNRALNADEYDVVWRMFDYLTVTSKREIAQELEALDQELNQSKDKKEFSAVMNKVLIHISVATGVLPSVFDLLGKHPENTPAVMANFAPDKTLDEILKNFLRELPPPDDSSATPWTQDQATRLTNQMLIVFKRGEILFAREPDAKKHFSDQQLMNLFNIFKQAALRGRPTENVHGPVAVINYDSLVHLLAQSQSEFAQGARYLFISQLDSAEIAHHLELYQPALCANFFTL